MKKLIFILSLGLMFGMSHINKIEAQMHVSINIDVQPAWGPSGYNYVEYYYIPEINVYFDVINRMFYYPNRGRWISALFLPVAYSYYDFYSLYKIVLNGVFQPWRYNSNHVRLYAGYRHNYTQVPIYYMNEPYYRRARVNYYGWVEPRYMPRNEGRPLSRSYTANTRNGRIGNEMRPNNSNNRSSSVRSSDNRNNNNSSVRSSSSNIRSNNNSSVQSGSNNRSNTAVRSRSNTGNNTNNTAVRSSSNTGSNTNNTAVQNSNNNRNSTNNTAVRSGSNTGNNNTSVQSSSNNNNRSSSTVSTRNGSSNSSSSRGNSSSRSDSGSSSQNSRSGRR